MPWARRLELALRGLTGVSGVIAAAALLWPASVPAVEIAPARLDGGTPKPFAPDGDVAVAGAIAQGNIFSETRSAPRARYRPLGPEVGEDVGGEAAAAGGEGVPQLYGIVPDADGAAALLRLDASAPGALLYRVGDRGGRFRVEEIRDQSVVLIGPAGRVELRLARPEESVR
jgi:hypothetical protein